MKNTERFFVVLMTSLFFMTLALPAFAHDEKMAGSKWFFGKDAIVSTIELAPSLLAEMKGIKERYPLIESYSNDQFRMVVADVIQPYIDKKLMVTVNDKLYPLQVQKVDRSNDITWKIWLSAKNVSFSRPVNVVKIEYRLFFDETDDTHLNISYAYLSADAMGDTARKSAEGEGAEPLARNIFDANVHVLELPIEAAALPLKNATQSLWPTVGDFVVVGIKHILTGYDHIAFLLALIVIGLSFKEVIRIITAFTIAHSITLLLAALQIFSLNSRFVEIVIAVSICYVAVENLLKKEVKYRWLLTFGFGLIHGFGFASTLQELIKGQAYLLPSVLSFNLGVEIGQIMIFLTVLPILYLLQKKFELRRVCAGASVAILATAFIWLVERVLDMKFLPF